MTKSKLYSGNVIDFEASGFGAESYPIEVGVVLESGKAYHSLIKPCSHWTHWTQEAQNTHRISRLELERDGKSIYEVCQDLNNLCGQSRLFSDCWVLDSQWMNTLFIRQTLHPLLPLAQLITL